MNQKVVIALLTIAAMKYTDVKSVPMVTDISAKIALERIEKDNEMAMNLWNKAISMLDLGTVEVYELSWYKDSAEKSGMPLSQYMDMAFEGFQLKSSYNVALNKYLLLNKYIVTAIGLIHNNHIDYENRAIKGLKAKCLGRELVSVCNTKVLKYTGTNERITLEMLAMLTFDLKLKYKDLLYLVQVIQEVIPFEQFEPIDFDSQEINHGFAVLRDDIVCNDVSYSGIAEWVKKYKTLAVELAIKELLVKCQVDTDFLYPGFFYGTKSQMLASILFIIGTLKTNGRIKEVPLAYDDLWKKQNELAESGKYCECVVEILNNYLTQNAEQEPEQMVKPCVQQGQPLTTSSHDSVNKEEKTIAETESNKEKMEDEKMATKKPNTKETKVTVKTEKEAKAVDLKKYISFVEADDKEGFTNMVQSLGLTKNELVAAYLALDKKASKGKVANKKEKTIINDCFKFLKATLKVKVNQETPKFTEKKPLVKTETQQNVTNVTSEEKPVVVLSNDDADKETKQAEINQKNPQKPEVVKEEREEKEMKDLNKKQVKLVAEIVDSVYAYNAIQFKAVLGMTDEQKAETEAKEAARIKQNEDASKAFDKAAKELGIECVMKNYTKMLRKDGSSRESITSQFVSLVKEAEKAKKTAEAEAEAMKAVFAQDVRAKYIANIASAISAYNHIEEVIPDDLDEDDEDDMAEITEIRNREAAREANNKSAIDSFDAVMKELSIKANFIDCKIKQVAGKKAEEVAEELVVIAEKAIVKAKELAKAKIDEERKVVSDISRFSFAELVKVLKPFSYNVVDALYTERGMSIDKTLDKATLIRNFFEEVTGKKAEEVPVKDNTVVVETTDTVAEETTVVVDTKDNIDPVFNMTKEQIDKNFSAKMIAQKLKDLGGDEVSETKQKKLKKPGMVELLYNFCHGKSNIGNSSKPNVGEDKAKESKISIDIVTPDKNASLVTDNSARIIVKPVASKGITVSFFVTKGKTEVSDDVLNALLKDAEKVTGFLGVRNVVVKTTEDKNGNTSIQIDGLTPNTEYSYIVCVTKSDIKTFYDGNKFFNLEKGKKCSLPTFKTKGGNDNNGKGAGQKPASKSNSDIKVDIDETNNNNNANVGMTFGADIFEGMKPVIPADNIETVAKDTTEEQKTKGIDKLNDILKEMTFSATSQKSYRDVLSQETADSIIKKVLFGKYGVEYKKEGEKVVNSFSDEQELQALKTLKYLVSTGNLVDLGNSKYRIDVLVVAKVHATKQNNVVYASKAKDTFIVSVADNTVTNKKTGTVMKLDEQVAMLRKDCYFAYPQGMPGKEKKQETTSAPKTNDNGTTTNISIDVSKLSPVQVEGLKAAYEEAVENGRTPSIPKSIYGELLQAYFRNISVFK